MGEALRGREEKQCGWLQDKFGVSWQIVPTALGKLMSDPDREKSGRVMKALLQMGKIDILACSRLMRSSKVAERASAFSVFTTEFKFNKLSPVLLRNRRLKMRFMVIVKASKDSEAGVMPSEELLAAMGKYNEELMKAGVLVIYRGCMPARRARV